MFANLQLSGAVAAEPVASGAAAGGAAPFSWLTDLVPSNLFAAASAGAILPLMLFTLAFALAARHPPPLLHALETAFQAVQETMFVLVGWLMRVAPPILFALAFRSASQSGLDIGGALLAFVVIWAIVLVCCIAAQYPLAVLGAGLSISRCPRAVSRPGGGGRRPIVGGNGPGTVARSRSDARRPGESLLPRHSRRSSNSGCRKRSLHRSGSSFSPACWESLSNPVSC